MEQKAEKVLYPGAVLVLPTLVALSSGIVFANWNLVWVPSWFVFPSFLTYAIMSDQEAMLLAVVIQRSEVQ